MIKPRIVYRSGLWIVKNWIDHRIEWRDLKKATNWCAWKNGVRPAVL